MWSILDGQFLGDNRHARAAASLVRGLYFKVSRTLWDGRRRPGQRARCMRRASCIYKLGLALRHELLLPASTVTLTPGPCRPSTEAAVCAASPGASRLLLTDSHFGAENTRG